MLGGQEKEYVIEEEAQKEPTILSDAFILESSSRHGKWVRVDMVVKELSPNGVDHIIQYMERWFNALELSHKAMNIVLREMDGQLTRVDDLVTCLSEDFYEYRNWFPESRDDFPPS